MTEFKNIREIKTKKYQNLIIDKNGRINGTNITKIEQIGDTLVITGTENSFSTSSGNNFITFSGNCTISNNSGIGYSFSTTNVRNKTIYYDNHGWLLRTIRTLNNNSDTYQVWLLNIIPIYYSQKFIEKSEDDEDISVNMNKNPSSFSNGQLDLDKNSYNLIDSHLEAIEQEGSTDIKIDNCLFGRIVTMDMQGSGSINIEGDRKIDHLKIKKTGSGDFRSGLYADIIEVDNSGSGSTEFTSDNLHLPVNNLTIKITGSGNFRSKLKFSNINAKVTGSGSILFGHLIQNGKFRVSGSGDIEGSSNINAFIDMSKSGSGSIKIKKI